MSEQEISISILCGEKGTGKTTAALQKWPKHVLLRCDHPLNDLKTLFVLEDALSSALRKTYTDYYGLITDLRKLIEKGHAIIFDCAEAIGEPAFKTVINTIISMSNVTLVFTFDVDYTLIFQCKVFRLLIDWAGSSFPTPKENFTVPRSAFSEMVTKELPDIPEKAADELLEIANSNFNNLKRLIWLVQNRQTQFDHISENVITEYSRYLMEEMFSDLPADLFDTLKKSSIIGEIFQKCILESPKGFQISGVKTYLEKLEAMNMLFQSYLDSDIYQFTSTNLHNGVLNCIKFNDKIKWETVLLNYYLEKIKTENLPQYTLTYLQQILRLSRSLNNFEVLFFANKKLLYHYLKIDDLDKARTTLDELIHISREHMADETLFCFFCVYKARLSINTGAYADALHMIEKAKNTCGYLSPLYLQYYYAKCLYGCGKVDESYQETQSLCSSLKLTSAKAQANQPLYALSYSLLATIQHHFGIGDKGLRYYDLALNHAYNKLEDKMIYHEIVKKSDMYYSFEISKPLMLQGISYFEEQGHTYEAAEIYVNLATEMMFHSNRDIAQAKEYLKKAIAVFERAPNEKLSYARNNLAIHCVIASGDFHSAVSHLEKALLIDLSDFTYMTLYLNLAVCYLKLEGSESKSFQKAYQSFKKYDDELKNRKNATQYENVYDQILSFVIVEHQGKITNLAEQADKILRGKVSDFFIPVLKDIRDRNRSNEYLQKNYPNNKYFYECLDRHKIFMAEFRFWE